jgi:hypothetical protein
METEGGIAVCRYFSVIARGIEFFCVYIQDVPLVVVPDPYMIRFIDFDLGYRIVNLFKFIRYFFIAVEPVVRIYIEVAQGV